MVGWKVVEKGRDGEVVARPPSRVVSSSGMNEAVESKELRAWRSTKRGVLEEDIAEW